VGTHRVPSGELARGFGYPHWKSLKKLSSALQLWRYIVLDPSAHRLPRSFASQRLGSIVVATCELTRHRWRWLCAVRQGLSLSFLSSLLGFSEARREAITSRLSGREKKQLLLRQGSFFESCTRFVRQLILVCVLAGKIVNQELHMDLFRMKVERRGGRTP
jgi:hypothetical protein